LRTKKFQTFWGLPVLSDSLCATGVIERERSLMKMSIHLSMWINMCLYSASSDSLQSPGDTGAVQTEFAYNVPVKQ